MMLPVITLDIQERTPTQNVWQNVHRMQRGRVKRQWALLVFAAGRPPRQPLRRCRITIERTSTQEPDRDNLYGGLKPLMDVLQPASRRHPYGLGFISDDGPKCVIDLVAKHVSGRRRRTVVTIEALPDD